MDDVSAILIPMLEKEEGLRLTAYDDANGLAIHPGSKVLGHVTIGIGRALDVNGISSAEADFLLRNDLAKVIALTDLHLPWWRDLSPNRRAVLAGMGFQMGMAGLMAFQNTLASVRSGNWDAAAAGMMASRWAQQTPARAQRMAQMMRAG